MLPERKRRSRDGEALKNEKISSVWTLNMFFVAAMIGVQIPQFVDQYGDAVYAHLNEAKASVAEFQQEADRYFDGSIERLIDYYRASDDPVLLIAEIASRPFISATRCFSPLGTNTNRAIGNVTKRHFCLRLLIFVEAWARYDYAVRLTPEALVMAVVVSLFISLLADLLLSLLLWPLRKRRTVAN